MVPKISGVNYERRGYGLYDRALGVAYLNGLLEAIEKSKK